jgi:hypothetical protein
MKTLKKLVSKTQLFKPDDSDEAYNHQQALLAFRTITKMLSLIPMAPTDATSHTTNLKDLSKAQRKDLNVLDALATTLVRRHEVVAVVAKDYDGAQLQVLASVSTMMPDLDNFSQNIPKSRPSWNPIQWLITANARNIKENKNNKEDSQTIRSGKNPTLVDPNIKISEKLSMAHPEALLETFLQHEW